MSGSAPCKCATNHNPRDFRAARAKYESGRGAKGEGAVQTQAILTWASDQAEAQAAGKVEIRVREHLGNLPMPLCVLTKGIAFAARGTGMPIYYGCRSWVRMPHARLQTVVRKISGLNDSAAGDVSSGLPTPNSY